MIISLNKLKYVVNQLKKQNKKVVFTNGCFDIIHRGHITLLKKAKSLGDVLIVGLNTDRSVKELKGKFRPLNNQHDRAAVLDSIKYVDYVVLFDELTPYKLITELKPDILVKGGDYDIKEIVGWGIVPKIYRIKILKGRSTTGIINRILKMQKKTLL
ncbi:MAG: D-glycero-beta-D-manno-heptose 1-phosphate adenylyltransferase [Endomicrobia bacterium]|nr:D-glycero-beta-D-manno-heptose 1-phosphate adenylyltransferase [Endomicrobiia bacterium]